MHRLIAYLLSVLAVVIALAVLFSACLGFTPDLLGMLPALMRVAFGIVAAVAAIPFGLVLLCVLRRGAPRWIFPVAGTLTGAVGGLFLTSSQGPPPWLIFIGALAGLLGGLVYWLTEGWLGRVERHSLDRFAKRKGERPLVD